MKQLLRFSLPLGFALSLLLGFSACSTVQETGRKRMLFTSPDGEAQQGIAAFQEIKKTEKISSNSAAKAQVQRVGRRIASVVNVPNAKWEFVVFEDSTPNAFALPGGKVGVNTGILPIAQNDNGLAVVLGHEVAHVTTRHGGERASQGTLLSVGGNILDLGLGIFGGSAGAAVRSVAMGAYGVGAQYGIMLPFSRTHEYEADQIGLLYTARAGYDPREAIAFWKRMAAASKGNKVPEFLATHPMDEKRIKALEKAMPAAMEEYRKATR
ncbi:MAG: M48 family metallopeptidase [Chthoniobacterales bacterium]